MIRIGAIKVFFIEYFLRVALGSARDGSRGTRHEAQGGAGAR